MQIIRSVAKISNLLLMIMSREIPKYPPFLGNRDNIPFFLFKVFSTKPTAMKKLYAYMIASRYDAYLFLEGIIELLKYMRLIKVDNGVVRRLESLSGYAMDNYLDEWHFYDILFKRMKEDGALSLFFSLDTVKVVNGEYRIIEHMIPHRLVSFKNILIGTGFLYKKTEYVSQLFIRRNFQKHIKGIIDDIVTNNDALIKRGPSIDTLKRSLHKKEQVGTEAELYVLEYEKNRLKGHPSIERISLISEDNVSAGFDIASFDSAASVFHDRFIEVKSVGESGSFFLSRNEMEVSRRKQGRYFLYMVERMLIGNIDYAPKIIKNPYEYLHDNDRWRKEIEVWKYSPEKNK